MSISDTEYDKIVAERDALKSALRALISCVRDLDIIKPDDKLPDLDRTNTCSSVGSIRIILIVLDWARKCVQ